MGASSYDAWKTTPPEGRPSALETVEGDLPDACPACGAPVWDGGNLAAHVALEDDHGVLVRCDAETAEAADEERVADAVMGAARPLAPAEEPCGTDLAWRRCACPECHDWDAAREAREDR